MHPIVIPITEHVLRLLMCTLVYLFYMPQSISFASFYYIGSFHIFFLLSFSLLNCFGNIKFFSNLLSGTDVDQVFYFFLSLNRMCSLRMYNSLVERCFHDCVDNFTRKTLQKQEETCVMRCAEKFLKHSMRVGMRFAELNSQAATQE